MGLTFGEIFLVFFITAWILSVGCVCLLEGREVNPVRRRRLQILGLIMGLPLILGFWLLNGALLFW